MFLSFRRKAKGDMQLNLEHHYIQSGGDKCPYFLRLKKPKLKYVVLFIYLYICKESAGGSAEGVFMLRGLFGVCMNSTRGSASRFLFTSTFSLCLPFVSGGNKPN